MMDKKVKENRKWFMVMGVFFLLLGMTAVIFPFISSLAVELLFGAMLMVSGGFYIVLSYRSRRWKGFLYALISGLIYMVSGLILLVFPIRGLYLLTFFIAALLFVSGLFRIITAFALREAFRTWYLGISGAFAILLSAAIMLLLPLLAYTLVGMVFGIELIITSIWFFQVGKLLRH